MLCWNSIRFVAKLNKICCVEIIFQLCYSWSFEDESIEFTQKLWIIIKWWKSYTSLGILFVILHSEGTSMFNTYQNE